MLLVTAIAGRVFFAPSPPTAPPPEVWISSLIPPDATAQSFASETPPQLPSAAPRPAALPPRTIDPVLPVTQADAASAPVALPASRPEDAALRTGLAETAVAPRISPRPPARPAALATLTTRSPGSVVPPRRPETRLAAANLRTPSLTNTIPARQPDAAAGRAALQTLASASGRGRDIALARQLEAGNMPAHLRQLVPVTLSGRAAQGRQVRITLCVMPDYLAIGDDRDFVRIPLGLPAAHRLAARFDMLLPTPRMVDAIHQQASTRLPPAPIPPSAQMGSTAYLLRHDATIARQIDRAGAIRGQLVSGHKKDLVLSNRLSRVSGRVAIYGWHRADGRPIQPLSTIHGQDYSDYSHGVRLVSATAFLDGRAVELRDLLADRRYAVILTGDEGPIRSRQLLAALR